MTVSSGRRGSWPGRPPDWLKDRRPCAKLPTICRRPRRRTRFARPFWMKSSDSSVTLHATRWDFSKGCQKNRESRSSRWPKLRRLPGTRRRKLRTTNLTRLWIRHSRLSSNFNKPLLNFNSSRLSNLPDSNLLDSNLQVNHLQNNHPQDSPLRDNHLRESHLNRATPRVSRRHNLLTGRQPLPTR